MTRVEVLISRYHYLEERLTKDQFRQIHLSWYATAWIADAILSGYGIKTAAMAYKRFRSEHIKIIDKEMFYPNNIFRNIKTELMWHLGIVNASW